ncbi:hypothetical protein, partial [Lacticaseibacillus nasuensis]|uniref:hypothetical protein n=1 Tax=Lacticaseibacillus nasuensis TaxID=944671 RepID=UPI001F38A528
RAKKFAAGGNARSSAMLKSRGNLGTVTEGIASNGDRWQRPWARPPAAGQPAGNHAKDAEG